MAVKVTVAERTNYLCSKPDCRAPTAGPHSDPSRKIKIGTAAHITAAAPSGPRYDPSITPAQRRNIENAIWLCATHGREVDADTPRYTAEDLRAWKADAER